MQNLTRRHSSTTKRFSWPLAILSFVVVALVNLSLKHFDRGALGNDWTRYVTRLYGGIRIYPLIEVYALYRLIEHLRERVERWPLVYVIPAVFFAFWMIEGRYFDTEGGVDFFYAERFFGLLCVLSALGYAVVYYLSFVAAEQLLLRAAAALGASAADDDPRGRLARLIERHPMAVTVIILLVVSIPFYYISYPALFMGDTRRQVRQALGQEQLYYMHPVMHTLLIRLCLHLGTAFFASDNAGMFIYAIVQGTIIILALAFCTHTLVRIVGIRGCAALLPLAVFLIHPRCYQYIAQVTKDTIFCACLLCFLCCFIRLALDRASKYEFIPWSLLAIAVILFRRDGLYIILPAVALIGFRRAIRIKAAALIAIILVFVPFWDHVVMPAMNVQPGSSRVMYSLVFQGTARYLTEHPDDITPEEHDAIDAVLKFDSLVERYNPKRSDDVIRTYRESATKEDMRAYFNATIAQFKRHPKTFIRAVLHNKFEYLYPTVSYPLAYDLRLSLDRINLTNTSTGTTHFEMPARQQHLYAVYQALREGFWRLPGLGLFISSFAAFYLSAFLICFALRKRLGRELVFSTIVLMQTAVIFAGPTNGTYFRYTFPIVMVLPIIFLLICKAVAQQNDEGIDRVNGEWEAPGQLATPDDSSASAEQLPEVSL